MSELKKIDDYLAGAVDLAGIEYIEVKAGDANFFKVSGGSHFFKVDPVAKSIYIMWVGADGTLVDNEDGKRKVFAYVDGEKVMAVLDRHTEPYQGLSQPKIVEIPTGADAGKALLETFKGVAATWFNNLYLPTVKDIEISVATVPPVEGA